MKKELVISQIKRADNLDYSLDILFKNGVGLHIPPETVHSISEDNCITYDDDEILQVNIEQGEQQDCYTFAYEDILCLNVNTKCI